MERLERAIEVIQSTIEDQGGELIVKMKVCLSFSGYKTRRHSSINPTSAKSSVGYGGAGFGTAHGESWARKCRSFGRRGRGGGCAITHMFAVLVYVSSPGP